MSSSIVLDSPRVLLAVRGSDLLNSIRSTLDAEGCQATQIVLAKDLRERLQEQEYSLAVIDLQWIEDQGLDPLRAKCDLPADLPVIYCSSENCTAEHVMAAVRAGARDVLLPPYCDEKMGVIVAAAREFSSERARSITGKSFPRPVIEQKCADTVAPHHTNGKNGHTQSYRSDTAVSDDDRRRIDEMLIGSSPQMAAIRRLICRVARTQAPVFITGESGTGKELVAHAIHALSQRRAGAFVPVNMAAIPEGLAESLLFGHEKGAFTNAVRAQQGWCEAANGGTLFLDEVGEMELQLQPKLLRFLQSGVIQRVGSHALQKVDARIIAATNRDPKQMVQDRLLREDLYFRLHVVPIQIPPLRERSGDIEDLAYLFLKRAVSRHGCRVEGFADETLDILRNLDWPGNVRQLENTVERLVIFARGPWIEPDEIPAELYASALFHDSESDDQTFSSPRLMNTALTPIQRQERAAIIEALQRADGHVVDAARLLGLGQATVYRKIKIYEIPHQRRRRAR